MRIILICNDARGIAGYHWRFPHLEQLPCWTTYTNKEVHDTLREAIAESPLYNGQIQSTGPRYCPSIETKLMTFPDKDQHPLFLEPEGEEAVEVAREIGLGHDEALRGPRVAPAHCRRLQSRSAMPGPERSAQAEPVSWVETAS